MPNLNTHRQSTVRNRLNWLKISLISLFGLILMLGSAMFSLIYFVNPNQYRPLISHLIKQQTGDKLKMGNLTWSFYPSIGLTIHNVEYTPDSSNKFKNSLITLEKGEFTLQIRPLLHGVFKVDKIILNGLHLKLVNDEIENNWQLETPNNSNLANNNYSIDLSEIRLTNSTIEYNNTQTKTAWQIPNLNLSLKHSHTGSISYFNPDGILNLHNVTYNLNQQIQGTLSLNYTRQQLSGNISSEQFSLNSVLSSLGFKPRHIFTYTPWQNLKFQTNFSANHNSFLINNTQLQLGKNILNLTLNATSLNPLLIYNQINFKQIELSDFTSINGYKLLSSTGNITGKIQRSSTNSSIVAQQSVKLNNLTLYGYDLHNLSLQIASILSNPLKIININETINQIKANTKLIVAPGDKNLALASNLGNLTTNLTYSNQQLNFTQLQLNGPDLRLNGNANINTTNNYLIANLNAQFVANPNTLTSKVIYPITINGNSSKINWNSVNQQIANNLGSSIIESGKNITKSTGSAIENIAHSIKNWF